jgi:glutathione synthase/RimK-type ligase-like ATP-grasp enzyme
MTRIAILQCGKLPSFVNWEVPNLDELFEEDKLLLQGFHTQAFQAQPVVWSRSAIDWNQFDIALIRSTWDYLDEQERFLQVLSQIETSSCRLFNPLAAVSWNIDKRYLFDLEKWDVPIIPTYLASYTEISTLHKLFVDRQVPTVILKPTIGLGGSHSYRVPLGELNHTLTKLSAHQPRQEYLIQPFIEGIVSEGEWSFVYFNRRLSHVLLKKPAPNDYRVQGIYGGTVHAVEPLARDLWQAEAALAKLPFDLLYARLDFVRAGNDLAIMEVELIEPILGFNLVPESVVHLVNAIRVKFEKHP